MKRYSRPFALLGLGASVVGGLFLVDALGQPTEHVVFENGSQVGGCQSSSTTSRWSSAGQRYTRTDVYGQDEDAWLMSINGLAVSPSGDLVIFDAKNARVHLLDGNLRQKAQFGRAGGGPGEFFTPTISRGNDSYFNRNLVAAGESSIYVFDGRTVQVFGYDGSYAGQRDIGRRGSILDSHFTLHALHATRGGVSYAYDEFDIYLRDRKLQTWTVSDSEKAALVHELSLAAPPGSPGMVSTVPNQARPVWKGTDECVIMGDGSSSWLLRLDLSSGQTDTLRLPRHEVPQKSEPGEHEEEQRRLLRQMRGIDVGETPLPTAFWRWAEMAVDPDGHIWINPWRPRAERGAPTKMFRIDPGGAVHQEVMPAFPLGFGPPGVIYTGEVDPDTDEVILVRYERRR